jgi:TP901-1 family phage major tail protein
MAKGTGKTWLLYVLSGSTYIKIGGTRTKSVNINNTEVDVTTCDTEGRWADFLPEAAVVTMTIELDGLFDHPEAGLKILQGAAISGEPQTMRLVTRDQQIDGVFKVDNFNRSAPYDNAETFNCTIKSLGAPTIQYL